MIASWASASGMCTVTYCEARAAQFLSYAMTRWGGAMIRAKSLKLSFFAASAASRRPVSKPAKSRIVVAFSVSLHYIAPQFEAEHNVRLFDCG